MKPKKSRNWVPCRVCGATHKNPASSSLCGSQSCFEKTRKYSEPEPEEIVSDSPWVSVENRLPDTYGSYDSYGNDLTVSNIVATNQGAACYCSSHDNYEGSVWIIVDWCHKEAGKKLDGVTHWMPLPTPPSGGEL